MSTLTDITRGKCTECGHIDDHLFTQYGSATPCTACDAAPINITRLPSDTP